MSSLAGRIAAAGRPRAQRAAEAAARGGGTHPGAVAVALGLHGLVVAVALFAADPALPPPPQTPVLDLTLAFPSPSAPAGMEAPPPAEALPEEEPLAQAEAEPAPESPPEPPRGTAAPPETPPPKVPEPAQTPEPDPPPSEPPREAAALPEPPAAPQPAVVQPTAQRSPPRQPRTPPAAEARSGAPNVQTSAESAPPAAEPAAAAAGLAEYRAALLRILRANHRYPPAAQARGDEGTVVVRFAVARDGRVLTSRVERGSGHAVLDEEAEALLRRVSPLPPVPAAAAPQGQLEILVPVAFRLR